MNTTNQFSIRMDRDLIEKYKDRCQKQGHNYTEVTRILLRDYAEGRITVGSTPTKPTIEDALL